MVDSRCACRRPNVTEILATGNLLTHVGVELPMCLDGTRLQLAAHHVPKTVASQTSALRSSRGWVVSVSGGVELDVPRVINAPGVQADWRGSKLISARNRQESNVF